ncbi:substrate-binding domain-containing protein [Microbacterium sp. ARD32]|uniref:substrate-binding domain-containing protein n=1 Tax=Microbacterium sp. ARD32 TaxID=2962577 RepID=UPI002881FAA7|nr:substrate-binding domain-containing protein [Microbacterium sp. ARD32]MDT0158224.1 substrate-binding domain-containing protein [Microbacterium sp. ARD32]
MTDAETPPVFGIARRERIMDQLRTAGAVRVADLAREFGVSELTIRRDIGELADRGLVTRVHGGATLRSRLDTTVAPRASAGGPRYRVGMVVPSLSYYWPQVVIGARAAATELGVQLVLRGASYDPADQRRQISSLVESGGFHGLIVAPENQGPDGHALLSWLEQLPIPVVLVERRVSSSLAVTKLEWVTTDHVFGGHLAAAHLASLGHRRVGILTSAQSPTSGQLRRGWAQAVDGLGLEPTVDLNASLDSLEGAERADFVGSLLDRIRETGTSAMLIHSDPQALLVQQNALDRGWELPQDLSIIAYDDEVAENGAPPITALRPPKQHVGRRAVEVMLARLTEGADRPVERVQVVPTLHARESTVSV